MATGALPSTVALGYAGSRPISFTLAGRVLGETGAPLPGTVILLKGTTQATITNAAGDFLLTVEASEPVLEFSRLGYQNQTILVKGRSKIVLTMYPVGMTIPLSAGPGDSTFVAIKPKTLVTADVMPAFPGGPDAYRSFLLQNAHYPPQARVRGQSGIVYLSFVVDEQGQLLEPQVLKGCGPELDAEALRLVRVMPRWMPGLVADQPVRVAYNLRINFGLTK